MARRVVLESAPPILAADRIVFRNHFSITPTHSYYDNLMVRFGAEGVVLTDVQPHENLTEGELLVGINGRSLDTFGNFRDNGKPYFSAFKNFPETTVKLTVANEEGKREVDYTCTRLNDLPRIHEPGCTPSNGRWR